MTYTPGDEYSVPQYARRGWRWECCLGNRVLGFGWTRRAALRDALAQR